MEARARTRNHMSDEISKLADEIESKTELEKLPDLRAVILAVPGIRRLYVAAAVRCLGARRFYFDKEAGAMQFEPDGTAVMRAVAWLSSYDAGLPMQTTVNLNLGGKDKELTPEDVIAQSPAMLLALERVVTRARKAAPKRTERPAELVEQAPG